MPDKAKTTEPKTRKPRPAGPPIKVTPGVLRSATAKAQAATSVVQIPKDLGDGNVRAELARQLMSSGVSSGLTVSDGNVLVQIPGHRAVRLKAGDWLVVTAHGARAMPDAAFKAAYDLEPDDADAHAEPPRSDGDAPVTDLTPQGSPVVTT